MAPPSGNFVILYNIPRPPMLFDEVVSDLIVGQHMLNSDTKV